jgi:hypothetical protein
VTRDISSGIASHALQMAAETVDFPGASLGYQSDIDVMAAEIASGTLSSGALSDSGDSSLDQLAAEVSMPPCGTACHARPSHGRVVHAPSVRQ